MTVLEVVDKLKELGDKLPLSSSDKSDIEVMYHEVFGRTFIRTSCSDCYRDAVIEMYSYLKKYGKMKEKSNYALKMVSYSRLALGVVKCIPMII